MSHGKVCGEKGRSEPLLIARLGSHCYTINTVISRDSNATESARVTKECSRDCAQRPRYTETVDLEHGDNT